MNLELSIDNVSTPNGISPAATVVLLTVANVNSTNKCTLCQGEYLSTEISAVASAWELMTGLENMPNVGTVSVEDNPDSVTLGTGTDATTAVWVVTFTSAVSEPGDSPGLQVRLCARQHYR